MNRAPLRPRTALPGLVLIVLVALLTAASCAEGVTESDICDDGLTTCTGACVDTRTDPGNCGACGNACPSDGACEAGACVAECSAALTNCNGSCVDLQTAPADCGGCGVACPDGTTCAEGVCHAGCPGGLSPCGGLCADLLADVGHCGDCDTACAPGEACVVGTCQACPTGQTKCGSLCVDIQTSQQNCGGCGLTCAAGFSCVDGQCQSPCDSGESYCNGSCVDTQTSQQHCGFCNNPCGGSQLCTNGLCACPGGGVCGLCGVVDLGSALPQSTSGSTFGALDAYTASCNGPGSGEATFSFTAPADGAYVFDTFGSSFDTVLSVITPGCAELDCNDDSQDLTSKITLNLSANETVIAVVDGLNGNEGSYAFNVSPAPAPVCPTADLGSLVPQSITGTTFNAGDALTPSCNAGTSADASYTFTAPADGSYAFDTFGSSYNTVLHVRDSGCAGPELACNDDANWNSESKVTVTLTQGQTVVVGVEGALGEEIDFVLNVNVAQPPVCPTGSLLGPLPQTITGTTSGAGDAITPACGDYSSADASYTFTAPSTDLFAFDTLGSAYNTVLSIRDGGCAGPELACNDDTPTGIESRALVQLTQGQTVVVAVDGAGGEEGAFSLTVSVAPPCPAIVLPSAVPQTVTGDTTNLSDLLTPFCGSPGSPEQTYGFTAPAAGSYTFDTLGSSFDTILHVHDAQCTGPELGCSDDAVGTTSEVTLSLNMGQTVVIVVDGFGGNAGSYTLNISN